MTVEDQWDEVTAARGWDAINDALDEIRSDGHGRFSLPNGEDILSHGRLDVVSRDGLVATVEEQARVDAETELLMGERNTSSTLQKANVDISGRMDQVAGARQDIIDAISADVHELRQLANDSRVMAGETPIQDRQDSLPRDGRGADSSDGPPREQYIHERGKAKVDFEDAQARERALDGVHEPARALRAVLLAGAVAGLVVDVLFVKTALAAQRTRGLGDVASLVLAVMLAAVLAVVASYAGHFLGKGTDDPGLHQDDIDEDLRAHWNQMNEARGREIRRARRMGFGLAAVALIIFLVLGWLRIDSIAEEQGSLPMTLLLICFALLGLFVIGLEFYSRARLDTKAHAAELREWFEERFEAVDMRAKAYPELEKRLDSLSTWLPTSDGQERDADGRPEKIDGAIAGALQTIATNFFDRVARAYETAGINFLGTLAPDDPRRKQIPRFDNLQPDDPSYTPRVQRYLNMAGGQS